MPPKKKKQTKKQKPQESTETFPEDSEIVEDVPEASEIQDKSDPIPKKLVEGLHAAFDSIEDDFTTWSPKSGGEIIVGVVLDKGVSTEFGTPFLSLLNKEKETMLVFLKSGLVPIFQRKGYLDSQEKWTDKFEELPHKPIAFRYEGKEKNAKSGRVFQKYKVLFSGDLSPAMRKIFGC